MKRAFRLGLGLTTAIVATALPMASCTEDADAPAADAGARDGTIQDAPATIMRDALPPLDPDAMLAGSYCALPGSLVGTAQGMALVPGGSTSLPDLSWLTVPAGYCVHHFANVAETRQLRVSPSGDVFAASPSAPTAGSENTRGQGAVVVLPDDDHDGVADTTLTFVGSVPNTQGLAFAKGYFYFQDGQSLRRVAFKQGDRAPSANIETVTTITDAIAQQFPTHWPKMVDVAKDGTVYFTNGSDQGELCYSAATTGSMAPTGTIFKIGTNGALSIVARGFRNPIALRCEKNVNMCLVAELAKDGSGASGGREKLVPLRQGDNWGFPCCATANTPYEGQEFQDPGPPGGQLVQNSDCASVTPESVSFVIGHTPFGIDFESSGWGAPWGNRAFVALHGVVGSFVGSRVVGVALDPLTGIPLPSSDLDGGSSGAPNMMDFVTGWDDGTISHGRATAVTFGDDGRMYVGDDTKGEIFWVAPVGLLRPQ
jgi:glucose/arabinose dehydrogenase